jgi:hypothetical protein
VYYLRLDKAARSELSKQLAELAVGHPSLESVMDAEINEYISNIRLEKGIALNRALKVIPLSADALLS